MAGGVAASEFCPYAALGLQPGALADDVRTAFRRAALRTHPDKPGGSADRFRLVQYAYECLAGQAAAAEQLSGAWFSGGAAPAEAFWSSGAVPAAGAAAFDPWSAATFDPWSATSFQAAAANGSVGGSVGSSCAAVLALHQEHAGGSSAQAVANAEAAQRHRRAQQFASDAKRQRLAGKGGGTADDARARSLTRFGVYGFRPESDSDGEAPCGAAAQRTARPGTAAAAFTFAGGRAVPAAAAAVLAAPLGAVSGAMHAPEAAAAAATAPGRASATRGAGGASAGAGRQFYCSLHNKIRFQSALVDDGTGKPVCRPGMECP